MLYWAPIIVITMQGDQLGICTNHLEVLRLDDRQQVQALVSMLRLVQARESQANVYGIRFSTEQE